MWLFWAASNWNEWNTTDLNNFPIILALCRCNETSKYLRWTGITQNEGHVLKTTCKGHLKTKKIKGHDLEDTGTNMNFNVFFDFCCQLIESESKHQRCLLSCSSWDPSKPNHLAHMSPAARCSLNRSKYVEHEVNLKEFPWRSKFSFESTCRILALVELDVHIFTFTSLLKNVDIYIYIYKSFCLWFIQFIEI